MGCERECVCVCVCEAGDGEGKKEGFGDATHVLVLGASYIHRVKILAFVYQGFVQFKICISKLMEVILQ